MTTESNTQSVPAVFDIGREMRQQTELLRSINGKLGFFVFIIIAGVIIQVLAALISF